MNTTARRHATLGMTALIAAATHAPVSHAQQPDADPQSVQTPPVDSTGEAGATTISPEPSITVSQALESCLTQVRIAENMGADSQEAFQKAQRYLSFVKKEDPENLRGNYLHARLLILASQSAAAMPMLQRWLSSQQGADDWEAHLLLGRIYIQGEAYKLAKPRLERAHQLNPTAAIPLLELAKCEAEVKEFDIAIEHIRSAIEILDRDVTAQVYVLFAQTLLKSGQIEAANRAVGFAVQLATVAVKQRDNPQSLKVLDDAYAAALTVKQTALQSDPTRGELYLELSRIIQERARVATRRADHEAMAIALTGVRSLGKEAPIFLVNELARLLARLGHRDEAIKLVHQVLERQPDNADAQQLYDAITAAAPDPKTKPQSQPQANSSSPDAHAPMP
jgi:tetratricopeptide (TPR) repeat protein